MNHIQRGTNNLQKKYKGIKRDHVLQIAIYCQQIEFKPTWLVKWPAIIFVSMSPLYSIGQTVQLINFGRYLKMNISMFTFMNIYECHNCIVSSMTQLLPRYWHLLYFVYNLLTFGSLVFKANEHI